jgi:hypothetical protein
VESAAHEFGRFIGSLLAMGPIGIGLVLFGWWALCKSWEKQIAKPYEKRASEKAYGFGRWHADQNQNWNRGRR